MELEESLLVCIVMEVDWNVGVDSAEEEKLAVEITSAIRDASLEC
jgi:hypothetical protein